MKNRKTPRGGGPGGPAGPLQAGLARADALIAAGQYSAAAEVLTELGKRHINEPEVLSRQLDMAMLADNTPAIHQAVLRLARQRPNDPAIVLKLAVARLKLSHVALAQRGFATFAERWPDLPRAALARRQAAELSEVIGERWAAEGLAGPPDLALMARNEELQSLLAIGSWQQAVSLGEPALRARPDFAPLANNLSMAYQNLGQIDKAIRVVRQILAPNPHNLHALGNLTRLLVLAGRHDEAATAAAQLKAISVSTVEAAVKQAEALSFIGDDAGVLAAFERVQKLKERDDDRGASALLHHLAAAASLRQGRTLAARRRWQKAIELNADLELAVANLADLERPADERHGPWAYSIEYWLLRATIAELMGDLRARPGRDDEAVSRQARRFLKAHPELEALVPLLLERGDPAAREFALHLAGLAATPGLLAALAAFAQGQWGPTDMRMRAAQLAMQRGALANGTVRIWRDGGWHDTLMFGMELHGEASPSPLPAAVVALQRDAAMAARAGKAAQAERLLQQALAVAPDDPSLLNNLGAVYGQLGRSAEAEAIARRLIAEHPDYLFARTNFVAYLIEEGKLDEAQALIEPLLQRTRMHFGEFGAVAGAQVNILLARGNLNSAESWLDIWEQAIPDHPHIELFRARLASERARSRRRRKAAP